MASRCETTYAGSLPVATNHLWTVAFCAQPIEERVTLAGAHGWWLERERGKGTTPAVSSRDGVKVTSFVRFGVATLLAVASFEPADANVTLQINWQALGLTPGPLVAPPLPPLQDAARFAPGAKMHVPAGQGWLVLIGNVSAVLGGGVWER